MVLFGGSIIAGGDILAEAIQNEVAKEKYYCRRCWTHNRDIEKCCWSNRLFLGNLGYSIL